MSILETIAARRRLDVASARSSVSSEGATLCCPCCRVWCCVWLSHLHIRRHRRSRASGRATTAETTMCIPALEAQARTLEAELGSPIDLFARLTAAGPMAVAAEFKRASPSKGDIAPLETSAAGGRVDVSRCTHARGVAPGYPFSPLSAQNKSSFTRELGQPLFPS
jgi:hypothetical protein